MRLSDEIFEICRRRGIIHSSFEIYGGVKGFYDYGPIGCRLKQNIERIIREHYVIEKGCLEVECPVLNPEQVWIASGHVSCFTDKLIECLTCGSPYKFDELHEAKSCPKCGGKLGELRDFNLMFDSSIGSKRKLKAYLRPETAQTTYVAFKRLWEVARRRLPFGVLQIGKAFRNEISPRQGMIRLREFTQAEVQFFVDPKEKVAKDFEKVADLKTTIVTKGGEKFEDITLSEALDQGLIEVQMIAYYSGVSLLLFERMGINSKRLVLRQHTDEERAFYSRDTWDIEFISQDFGRVELVGISDRGDYDLKAQMELSGTSFEVTWKGRKFIPHVIEVAYGIDRPLYCVLESCFTKDGRRYFRFPPRVAPYAAGVFPLLQRDDLAEKAREVFELLKANRIYCFYDDAGSIGRRYVRADEIGVPFCITVDHQTLRDNTVTIRFRDTRQQIRLRVEDVPAYLLERAT